MIRSSGLLSFLRLGLSANVQRAQTAALCKYDHLSIVQQEHPADCLCSPFAQLSIRGARCSAPTKKRRKTYPYSWWAKAGKDFSAPTDLTKENKQFLDDIVQDRYGSISKSSPLKLEQFERGAYEPGSVRCGVIARKIGQQPMWTKSGRRILTTALQIVDNHVVSYIPNEEFVARRRPFYNTHPFRNYDVLVVGAENADPRAYPAAYRGLFEKANLPPKTRLTRFFITPNAKLAPGTPLHVNHFRVGDYVDVWGKTRDHGFQGVMKRWNFKGQLKYAGVTKAHRRPGSIARGRKLMGPLKGKKMPGHMGSERRILKGLKIWRINTKYNVIWVHGPAVPGANNSWCYIYDCKMENKYVFVGFIIYAKHSFPIVFHRRCHTEANPPPFPTYYKEDKPDEEVPENIYDNDLHAFDAPSLLFEETEEEKKAALAALKMSKKAKIAKIR